MRARILLLATLGISAGVVACVGDEPSAGTENDASTGDATSGDAGGNDSAVSDAASDAGTWSPSSLTGLALWLADDSIDVTGGTDVAKWQDKSGKGNDAVPSTDAGVPPQLLSAGIGGRQSVHFNGTSHYLYIVDSASLRFGDSGFVLAAVERHAFSDASAGGGFIYAKLPAASPNPGPSIYVTSNYPPYSATIFASVDSNDYTASVNDAGIAADVAHIEIFRWVPDATGTAGALELTVDGVPSTKRLTSLPDISATGVDPVIGVNPNNHTFYYGGDIATVIAVDGPTSDSDVASLTAYLKGRYSL